MRKRSEEPRLYCTECETQPAYFHERIEDWINEVTPDGRVLRESGERRVEL